MLANNRRHGWITYISFVKRIMHASVLLLLLSPAGFAQSKASSAPIDVSRDSATRSIAALKRLEKMVLVYPSLADHLEANGKLARVSFESFNKEFANVTQEVESLLSRLPEGKLKVQIMNALYSYRDGTFWWSKIDQLRVISVFAYSSLEATRTTSETAFASTIPYTVVIHWRQARKYLRRAERLISRGIT